MNHADSLCDVEELRRCADRDELDALRLEQARVCEATSAKLHARARNFRAEADSIERRLQTA